MRENLLGRSSLLLLLVFIGLAVRPATASVIPEGADLWFGTQAPAISFSAKGIRYLGPGSILSISGNVIATNQQLLADFQPRFAIPWDRGLDALAITGKVDDKTIIFSTTRSFYSNALKRTISDGDLIDNKGDLLATNSQLLAAFSPKGSNFGLDAAVVRDTSPTEGTEYWFSTGRTFYSNTLKETVNSGDVLSNRGTIIARASDMLAPFKPRNGAASVGLDALYVDEEGAQRIFWFSTNKDFYSNSLNRWIRSSDLIASDGTIVMTQKQITQNFGFVFPICSAPQLTAALLISDTEKKTPEPATLTLLLIAAGAGLVRRRG